MAFSAFLRNNSDMTIEIDNNSGFCFGVVNAIKKAEQELEKNNSLFCLGDIVHNEIEVERLKKKGLSTISHADLSNIYQKKILIRAHGEPPSTYELAKKQQLNIIDATCPVVLGLQKKIHAVYEENDKKNTQIVIFGKKGHAEVNGLVGQTENTAIVVEKTEDLAQIDFTKNIFLFSQTTQSVASFNELVRIIQKKIIAPAHFVFNDSICREVSNRIPHIQDFARKHDIIIFVSGKKSSNGKVLFNECKLVNSRIFFVSEIEEVATIPIENVNSIGICGATSTPMWLMEAVEKKLGMLFHSKLNSN